jgi:hypothetical protein
MLGAVVEVDRRVLPILLLVLAACTGSPAAKGPSTTPNPRSPEPPSGNPASGIGALEPVVWFAPLPPPSGSVDFMDLFGENASWPRAAGHVRVFQLSGEWAAHQASDDELRRLVADLRRRGMAVAFEAAPLVPSGRCGGPGVEGFGGPAEGLRVARRLAVAGATEDVVRFVSLDGPYAFGHASRAACRRPARIVREVAAYVKAVRRVFSDLEIGDVEPLPADMDPNELKRWITTYARVTGSELSFFHLDVDSSRPGWAEAAMELEGFCRARGIPFGIVYAGQGDTGDAWSASAEDLFVTYEARTGARPDEVVFQSRRSVPDHVLPESRSGTFTHLIDRYLRTRTALDMEVGPSEYVGSFRASGTLVDASGKPLPSATIRLTLVEDPGAAAPRSVELGTRVTDGTGAFRLTFHPPGVFLHLGTVRVKAWFQGDDRRWPAYAVGSIAA